MQEHGGRRSRPQRRDNMFVLDFLFHPELVEGCVKSQIPIETSGTKERVVVLAQHLHVICYKSPYLGLDNSVDTP